MASYQLSLEADADIDDILTFGIHQFGLEAALHYHDLLKNHFEEIAQHPLHHMKVDYITFGTRRSVFRSHSIYFNLNDGDVFIERIIGRQVYNK